MKKNKKIIYIFVIFLTLVTLSNVNFAEENEVIFKTTELTEEYKNWLKIPQEERENYIVPQVFESCEDITDNSKLKMMLNNKNESNVKSSVPANLTSYTVPYYGDVKNQGSTSSCWAFSAATVFASNYYHSNNQSRKLFSNFFTDFVTSLNYNPYGNGFYRQFDSGGNMGIAAAYATNGMGIALQSEMNSETLENPTYVYNNIIQNSNISASTIKSELSNVKKSAYVKEYIMVTGKDEIKEFLYNYGALSGLTYASDLNYFSYHTANELMNRDIAYYCDDESESADHAITIIGWDDDYTNSEFSGKKGAYTVLNSWGSYFGQNGIYHIFYDDVFMQTSLVGIVETKDIDYDNLYQYDDHGCISAIGSPSYSTIYGANVFNKKTSDNEQLTQVGFYAPTSGNYSIYLNANGSNCSVSNAQLIVNNYSVTKEGYYTVELSNPVKIENSKFSLIIKNPNGYFAGEFPYSSGYWFSNCTSNTGESYMSLDGESYMDLYSCLSGNGLIKINVCLKAFTSKAYTVTFNSNGGSTLNSQDIFNGKKATKPTTNPVKNGYIFKYWYLNDESQEFDFVNTAITENITLNAKYIELNDFLEESELPFETETLSEKAYIKNIKSKTSVVFDLDDDISIKVLSKSNDEKTSGVIGTGDTIKIYQNDIEIGSYTAIITGDPTGDGSINIADIILERRYIIGDTNLQNEYIISADVTDDENVNVNDVMQLRKHIIGTESIE